MNILGISAYYHDSAACLVQDGRIVAAAQEERFTRKKHDYRFPENAVDFCLAEGGIRAADLDLVTFYDKPLLKFDRLLETYISYAPSGFKLFLMGMPLWLRQKLHTPRELDAGLKREYKGRYVFTEHHESHAASAFYPSPFEEAAVLTLDGVGEWATGSIAIGRGNRLEMLKEMRFPHSLGLLYSAFTYFTGFKVNSGEYKLMGLAPYGEPVYKDLMIEKLLDIKDDGSFRMDMSYFGFCDSDVMTSRKMDSLFGGPPRKAETEITQREMDIAASIQAVTEEIVLKIARYAHELTGARNLTMAGGVALNCVANGRVLREGPFDQVWIQPAAGDAGGALGAALFTWHELLDKPREVVAQDSQYGSLLGPSFSNDEIRAYLDSAEAIYHYYPDENELVDRVAELIASEQVVGHFSDRAEFGPRALGSRSILGDARSRNMQATMNLKIKFRESFRPFAPAVLREHVDEFFEMRPDENSPYMLLVAPVRDAKRLAVDDDGARGLDKLKQLRSTVPAITHVDYSARVQTIDMQHHPRFYKIIERFKQKTGSPVVINTSFNVRGEPIVNTPEDAFRCFMYTNMDALVLENFVILKQDQPNAKEIDVDAYLAEFALD
ncbi:MAG: carbamoyltransferase [Spirochaetaceae bacterium]|nr:carbamoyltransferase [Myxococcales bacterium]MCB9725271.1 carbamoyltransferase [Spirochaetaceae bacterium]